MTPNPPSTIFTTMSRDELIQGARQYGSRPKYLASLGFTSRHNRALEKRMVMEKLSLNDLWPNRYSQDVRFPEEPHVLDLTNEDHAYFYGLALADGHLQALERGRGKLTIGLKSTDRRVLDRIVAMLPWKAHLRERSRVTNFGPHTCCEMVYMSRGLRAQLVAFGFPVGKKSDVCGLPNIPYHERGFWRGFIDGDGSLGYAAGGYPFLALVTTSDAMADGYKVLLFKILGLHKESGRNTRDNAYNITIYRDQAVAVARHLYPDDCLSIDRKYQLALKMRTWTVNQSAEGAA